MSDSEIKEQVKEATDIVGVIGQFVSLKKRGSNFLGLCPFHTEKTPSFSVNGDRQFFHCFGCGKGGDVFTFLMEHEGWSFPEVLKYCADRAGISLPERRSDDDRDGRRRKAIHDALSLAGEIYHRSLFSSIGKPALDYLHERGFTDETLRRAGVGYAPPAFDTLMKSASNRGISDRALLAAGLAKESQRAERPYDVFRNRIIFPIHSLNGKIIGFGGRALSAEEPAKYINSPETEVYHKGRILYGLHTARDAIRRAECAILVEGYMDWLAMLQHGLENVVAVSGTALSDAQAALLSRFCSRITLMYDADSAGQRAALRGIDVAFNAGLAVDILPLPEGDDPDSFLKREGAKKLQAIITKAPSVIEFRIDQERASKGTLTFIDQEKLAKEFLSLAKTIRDADRRRTFIGEVALSLSVSEERLLRMVAQPDSAPKAGPRLRVPADYTVLLKEEDLLKALYDSRECIDRVRGIIQPNDLDRPVFRRMFSAIVNHESGGRIPLSPQDLGTTPEEIDLWARIIGLPGDPSMYDKTIAQAILRSNALRRREKISEMRHAINRASDEGDHEKSRELTKELSDLMRGGQTG